VALINLDGVGAGHSLSALAARNYPAFWEFIETANQKYIHRTINPSFFSNIARPRLDAARFLWKGVPSISLASFGSKSFYHVTKDSIEIITPEIMEDLAQLLFVAVLNMANADSIDFRKDRVEQVR
jgi:Iap family predicted aminopeptidase